MRTEVSKRVESSKSGRCDVEQCKRNKHGSSNSIVDQIPRPGWLHAQYAASNNYIPFEEISTVFHDIWSKLMTTITFHVLQKGELFKMAEYPGQMVDSPFNPATSFLSSFVLLA